MLRDEEERILTEEAVQEKSAHSSLEIILALAAAIHEQRSKMGIQASAAPAA
jgi:hypothetical protein